MNETKWKSFIESGGLLVEDGVIWYGGVKHVPERTCCPVRHEGHRRNGWWSCSECEGRVNGSIANRAAYCQTCGARLKWDEVER